MKALRQQDAAASFLFFLKGRFPPRKRLFFFGFIVARGSPAPLTWWLGATPTADSGFSSQKIGCVPLRTRPPVDEEGEEVGCTDGAVAAEVRWIAGIGDLDDE